MINFDKMIWISFKLEGYLAQNSSGFEILF